MYDEDVHTLGVAITAFIVFIGSWIYCIVEYGYLLGVGLGWLPSIIVAVIAGALWPLIAIAIIVCIAVIAFFALNSALS